MRQTPALQTCTQHVGTSSPQSQCSSTSSSVPASWSLVSRVIRTRFARYAHSTLQDSIMRSVPKSPRLCSVRLASPPTPLDSHSIHSTQTCHCTVYHGSARQQLRNFFKSMNIHTPFRRPRTNVTTYSNKTTFSSTAHLHSLYQRSATAVLHTRPSQEESRQTGPWARARYPCTAA